MDRRRRRWLAAPPQAYGLAGAGQEAVGLGRQPRRSTPLLAALPDDGWTRLSAGHSTTGPRGDDWRWRPVAEPLAPAGRRWRLVRRRGSAPHARHADVVFAPHATPLEAVVRGAASRWTIAQRFEAAQGEVGVDQSEVWRWTGW